MVNISILSNNRTHMRTNEHNNAVVIVFENEQFNIVIIKKHA